MHDDLDIELGRMKMSFGRSAPATGRGINHQNGENRQILALENGYRIKKPCPERSRATEKS